MRRVGANREDRSSRRGRNEKIRCAPTTALLPRVRGGGPVFAFRASAYAESRGENLFSVVTNAAIPTRIPIQCTPIMATLIDH